MSKSAVETKEGNENLLEEYRVLNKTVESRWSAALLADSILLPSSVLVVMFAVQFRSELGKSGIHGLAVAGFIPIIAAVLLVVIPYFLHYSTTKLINVYFDRICEIEKELKIKGHHHIEKKKLRNPWPPRWYNRRYNMDAWHFFFLALIAMYIFTALWIFVGPLF